MKSPSHANRRNRSNIERERGADPTLNSALTQITGAQPTLQANDDNGSFFPSSPWIVHLYIESISILYINDAISRPLRGDDRGAQKCCLFALSVSSCGCHPGRPSMHRRSRCRPTLCPKNFLSCRLAFIFLAWVDPNDDENPPFLQHGIGSASRGPQLFFTFETGAESHSMYIHTEIDC